MERELEIDHVQLINKGAKEMRLRHKTLDEIKANAQQEANRTGKPHCVINLNTIGAAMYVVRVYMPAVEQGMYAHQFVAKFEPMGENGRTGYDD